MKRILLVVLAAALFAPLGATPGGGESCDALVAESEKLWMNNDFDASDRKIEEAMKICPGRAELYWRKARNEFDRIETMPRDKKPPKEELVKRYEGMEELALKCMELEPDNGDCYLWKSVGQGRRGTTQGILSSLGEIKSLEKNLLKAEELAPTYRSEDGAANSLGDIYNALGQYYRVLPEWLCVFGLKQIFGSCGDLEKSVEYQRKAAAREPQRIEYAKELGVSLICYGQKRDEPDKIEEGKKILKALQDYPEIKSYDKIDKEQSLMVAADPSLACGYSRDAQQEQSKDAYDKQK